ncbi:MAG: hypothetical protein J6M07_10425, partial [Ruminococcus sp.]|nr:hypothetical protein [Ruminococcus sp.]
EALYVFIGGNLSEERFPLTEAVPSVSYADISPHCGESAPNPFPKTFNRILPLIGRSTQDVKTSSFTGSALSGAKLILKVLGREFEGSAHIEVSSIMVRLIQQAEKAPELFGGFRYIWIKNMSIKS